MILTPILAGTGAQGSTSVAFEELSNKFEFVLLFHGSGGGALDFPFHGSILIAAGLGIFLESTNKLHHNNTICNQYLLSIILPSVDDPLVTDGESVRVNQLSIGFDRAAFDCGFIGFHGSEDNGCGCAHGSIDPPAAAPDIHGSDEDELSEILIAPIGMSSKSIK